MLELCHSFLELPFAERNTAFGNVQISILFPVVRGNQCAALLQLSNGLVLAPRPPEGQSQLIDCLGILRLEAHGLPEFSDGLLDFPDAEKCPA